MRDQTNSPVLLGLIVVAVLCGRAPAQTNWIPQETSWIGLAGQGAFSRACAGDFDADGFPDAAFLRGSQIVLGISPGSNPWSLPADYFANDFAILALEDGRDAVIFVRSAGVYQGTLSSSGAFTALALAQGAWANAKLVEVGDTDIGGNLTPVIVGVMSDLRTLRKLLPSSGEWSSSPISLSPALQSDAQEIALSDLNGDQELELVIAAGSTLAIYELDGSLAASYSYSGYTTTGLAVGHMGDGSDWIAWTAVSGGTDCVLAFDQGGLKSMPSLGSVGVVSVASAEWTADGHSDLVLGLDEASADFWVLTNTGTNAPSFSTSAYTAFDIGSTQTNASQAAVADVDADGDEDLLCPVAGTSTAALCRNGKKNHHLLEALIVLGAEAIGDLLAIPHEACSVAPVNDSYTLQIRVSRPPSGEAAQATHVAYAAWKQSDPGNEPQRSLWETDPVAVVPQLWTSVEVPVDIPIYLPDPGNHGCGQPGVTTTHIYYVELQLQERNVSGALVREFPAKLLGVQTEGAMSTNGEYLSGLKIAGTITREVFLPGEDPVHVGTSDEMSEMPNLTPGIPIQK